MTEPGRAGEWRGGWRALSHGERDPGSSGLRRRPVAHSCRGGGVVCLPLVCGWRCGTSAVLLATYSRQGIAGGWLMLNQVRNGSLARRVSVGCSADVNV